MTEILTESFCERCGTRYTFESARPKTRLKGVKVLSRGLKNFVLSDDTSIDEAMAAARSETDREASAHQLDAFHKTFSFCMSCRQYTCPNCWNETEARCLSCAPLELPDAPVRLEDLAAFGATGLIGDTVTPGNGTDIHEHDAWPEAVEAPIETGHASAKAGVEPDLERVDAAPVASEPVASELVAAEPVTAGPEPEVASERIAADANPAPQVAAEAADSPAVAASDALDPAGKAVAQTTGLLRRFRPGQSLDDELAAFELERTGATPSGAETGPQTPEPVAASIADGTEVAASAAEATPEPTGEAPAPAAAAEAQPEPEPQPLTTAAGADVVEQPTWQISAPDPGGAAPRPPSAAPGSSIPLQDRAAKPDASGDPQWPARPQWPGATPDAGLPFLGRPATPNGGIEALWAASNQELVTAAPAPGKSASTGIQPCISCGLSLSATARFCRRCGTLQGR